MATGNNNNLAARDYALDFKQLLQAVFEEREYFGDFFAGGLQALDGVQNNATAFTVKTSDIAVAVNNYNTGANVGMGTGTSSSSRFGDITEIIYVNTDVPYTWNWAIHEGLDRFSVNNDMLAAEADRLELQAQAKVAQFNAKHSLFIHNQAAKAESVASVTDANIKALFNTMAAYFVDKKTVGKKIAKVNSTIWNLLIDTGLTVKDKGSSVNIDRNTMVAYKGFEVTELPSDAFQGGDIAYFYVEGVGAAFTGINTVRSIEATDFDGRQLQGAGKAGEYILPDNKVAVARAYVPSSAKAITSFKIGDVVGTIDETNHTVTAEVAHGTALTALTPTIVVSAEATVSPASGAATDFTNAVTYTVTAEDGTTQAYTVTVTAAAE